MRILIFIVLGLLSLGARADCLTSSRLTGVNLAGAEFNASKLPGRMNFDFVYPSTTTMDYFRNIGVTIFRLPITWERLQPSNYAALESIHINELIRLAKYAKNHDLCLLIDLHNFGKFNGRALSDYSDASNLMSDFWLKVSAALVDYQGNIAFGLMNEPAKVSRSFWASTAQSVVEKLRINGVTNLIIVAGGTWSGAHSWFSGSTTDPSNANLFSKFSDSLGRTVIELHQYADSNYSGTSTDCINTDKMRQFLDKVSDWGNFNNQKLFLGEFGVPVQEPCLNVLQVMLDEMQSSPWVGWSYWAAGAWWGDYPLSIQPMAGNQDKPQMVILAPFLNQ